MGTSWIVDFAAFALAGLFFDIPVSQAIARACGALTGFLLHKFATFRPIANPATVPAQNFFVRQFFAYTLLWLFGWIVSTAGILAMVQWTPLNKFVAKFSVEVLLVPVNYLIMRRFIFRKDST